MGRVEELEELLKKATPGPWETATDGETFQVGHYDGGGMHWIAEDANRSGDAALIVAAVNALPDFIALAKAARACANETSIAGAGDRWLDVLAALARLDGK